MELLILVAMAACCAVLIGSKTTSLPLMLGVLSLDIIASFVVIILCGGSGLAIPFFIANLVAAPWVVFALIMKRVMPERRGGAAD